MRSCTLTDTLFLASLQLPYNSGWRLSSLEEEDLVRSCVANLVGLSRFQMATVLKEITAALETLNRVSSSEQ